MPDGDILKATLEGTFAGEPFVIGLGFVSNAGAASFKDDADELSAELRTALDLMGGAGAFVAPLSAQFELDAVRIQDLSPGLAAGIVYPVGAVGGNTVDDAMAPSLALCVTWRTGLKGKENRGRSYLTGFAEDSGNAGFWIPEIQAWADAAFATPLLNAFGPLGPGNYALSVVHTVAGGARLHPPTATPIIDFTVRNTARSLRRRSVGVRISRRRSAP